MRHSNQTVWGRWPTIPFVGLFAFALTACGSGVPASVEPAVAPTPVVTPDPHLREPVTADEMYIRIGKGGLKINAVNANLGQGNPDIGKVINADIGGWPVRITQFKSTAVRKRILDWTPGQPPGGDEAPYAFAGLNILITFGPISARAPTAPEPTRVQAATALVAILDPLLWPLDQRSVVAIPSRTPVPVATPVPSPSPTPKATPKPAKSKAP